MQQEQQEPRKANDWQTIRVQMRIAEKVKTLSRQEDRNLNNMFTVLIKEALTARGIEC